MYVLQEHLMYVMHTFELTSQKVSISFRFPMQKKDFAKDFAVSLFNCSLFSQWIV